MKKFTLSTLLFAMALGGLTTLSRAADATATAAAADSGPNRLIDGVSVDDFQTIQIILLKAAAADKDIAIIDAQMSALRAQRADLNFKAAAREHPELVDKLKVMFDLQRERQKQENAMAREAAKLLKQQGP